jgi:hypothetical protein
VIKLGGVGIVVELEKLFLCGNLISVGEISQLIFYSAKCWVGFALLCGN